jgi:uncharacterized membrane protein HdeD (DUF308 family)
MVIFPALAISSLVIGVNLVSDGVKQLVTALEQRGVGLDVDQALEGAAPYEPTAQEAS